MGIHPVPGLCARISIRLPELGSMWAEGCIRLGRTHCGDSPPNRQRSGQRRSGGYQLRGDEWDSCLRMLNIGSADLQSSRRIAGLRNSVLPTRILRRPARGPVGYCSLRAFGDEVAAVVVVLRHLARDLGRGAGKYDTYSEGGVDGDTH